MTFEALETSRESGNLIEFFVFTQGVVTTRFTSFNRDINFGGFTFLTTQISRTEVQASVEDSVNEIKITLPLDNPIPQQYINNVPGRLIEVQVLRAHADDPIEETLLVFSGFIAQVNFDGALEATLTCSPNTAVFKRAGPRFNYQGLCNHILYDDGCKVDINLFTFTGNVSDVSGRDITVDGLLAAKGAGFTVSGFVRTPASGTDDSRLVLAQAGDVLTLLNAFSVPVLNTDVDVFAGCAHDITTCDVKFAAVLNYGGFPFVPEKNPFNSSLRGGK